MLCRLNDWFSSSPNKKWFTCPHNSTILTKTIFFYRIIRAVFDDGRVCISILHPPGTDKFNELVSNLLILYESDNFMMNFIIIIIIAAVKRF